MEWLALEFLRVLVLVFVPEQIHGLILQAQRVDRRLDSAHVDWARQHQQSEHVNKLGILNRARRLRLYWSRHVGRPFGELNGRTS